MATDIETDIETQIKCEYPGCEEKGVACYFPDNESGEPDEHFCTEHCHERGYCYLCGGFFGGIERFDFSETYGGIKGLCEDCEDEVRSSCDDVDEDDLDYPYSEFY